jgi:glyoxylase I family protein
MDRRQVLLLLASASSSAIAADKAAPPTPESRSTAPPADPTPKEKVWGIGGIFFRANDPGALGQWYRDNLGINLTPSSHDMQPWHTEAGVTVFAPFPQKTATDYFGSEAQMWMVNFRVRDLDKIAVQLQSKGIAVKIDPVNYPHGRFARLQDPEGNPVELWQPKAPQRTV